MEEDHGLSLEEAVSHAINAHNAQINRRGFSPRQIMFGKICKILEDPANTQPMGWNGADNQGKAIGQRKPEEIYEQTKLEEQTKMEDRMWKSMNEKRYEDGTL